jgi:DNA invertase Pin-like site-specific DNA recombinase
LNDAGEESDRAVIYLRVSTPEEDLVGQERELLAYCSVHGWVVEHTFSEKVSGAGKVERREYDRLLRGAAQPNRSWKHLLVWALDRFSREATFTRATQAILDLEHDGVRFHSVNEPMLDTPEDGRPNPGRDVLLALLPVIASFESQRRSERVRMAMQEIKEKRRKTRSGRPPGRPVRATPEKVAMIMSLKSAGYSYKVIAQQVGLPRGTCANVVSRVRRGLLQNPLDTNGYGHSRPRPTPT